MGQALYGGVVGQSQQASALLLHSSSSSSMCEARDM
jgi:hypothetical protein